MRKIYYLLIFFLMIQIAESYTLSNSNYKMSIGIVSSANLSNENYKLKVNLYPLSVNLSNNNYKMKIGYLVPKEIISAPPEEEVGEGISSVTGTSHPFPKIIDEPIILCPEGKELIDGICKSQTIVTAVKRRGRFFTFIILLLLFISIIKIPKFIKMKEKEKDRKERIIETEKIPKKVKKRFFKKRKEVRKNVKT